MDWGNERFVPNTIISHVVKIVITWSIKPNVNNNIGRVFHPEFSANVSTATAGSQH